MSKAVLIVDDEREFTFIAGEILKSRGIEVHEAHDGAQALMALKSFTPDVILMDMMMPVMDGMSLIHILQSNKEWSSIPVIIVSARSFPEDRENALRAGIDGFLEKPFSAQQLQEAIHPYLEATTT
jgi:two-component system cell cycle response regulator DivK